MKFLRKTLLQDQRIIRRFIGEARTVAGLDHPHIVRTHGLGRTGGGSYFIVMDLVDGRNLERLAASRIVAIAEAIRWTIEACAALEHAHEMGVIHCDLKPANLLLDETGAIRVTDFGLALALGTRTVGGRDRGNRAVHGPRAGLPMLGTDRPADRHLRDRSGSVHVADRPPAPWGPPAAGRPRRCGRRDARRRRESLPPRTPGTRR